MNTDSDSRRDLPESFHIFDIETEDWDTFVCGGLLGPDGDYQAWDYKGEDSFADAILGIDGYVFAHSGGTFDFKWLLDHALRRKLPVSSIRLSGSSVVSMTVNKHCKLRDTHALFKIPLKDLTKSQGIAKVELNLPCRCGEDCGGYCSLRRGMPAAHWKQTLYYLEHDCRSLRDAILHFRDYASAVDLDLCATVGSSAWRNARRVLDLRPPDLEPGQHKYVRKAYYGGRVQVFRPVADSGFECDVNSMYPAQLASQAVPIGRTNYVVGAMAHEAYEAERPGIYHARVLVPEMFIPPLPYRCGTSRIAYPTGEFDGYWTLPELRYADGIGVHVECHDAIVWEQSRIVFKPWVNKIWSLRFSAPGGKSGPLGTFLKFVANSLTGKLGANPQHDQIEIDPKEIRGCNARNDCPRYRDGQDCGGCCIQHCNGWCGAHYEIFADLDIWGTKRWRLDECCHPEWSSYLTSCARVVLHKQLVDDGKGGRTSLYCDTDSVLSSVKRTANLSDKLGDFEDKGEFRKFRALAPKVYSLERDDKDGRSKRVYRAKGIRWPKQERAQYEAWEALADGKTPTTKPAGIVGFRAGAYDGKFFQRNTVVRTLKGQGYGDRIMTNDGTTRAPTIEECREKWGRCGRD